MLCNCRNVSRHRKVLLESCAAVSAASDLQKLTISEVPVETDEAADEESSEEVEEDDDKEFGDLLQVSDREQEAVKFTSGDKTDCISMETLFTESFQKKGSSLHKYFQRCLRSSKEKLKNKISVPLKLRFEPTNRKDENAILVLAYPVNSWEPIGYL